VTEVELVTGDEFLSNGNVASRRIAIVATTNSNRHRALSQQFGERRNPKSEGGNEGGK
jgi:hypothetical protein